MSLGIPVIATATGGVPEIIGQDRFGMLVVPGSWEDLYRGMRDYLLNRHAFISKACAARIYTRDAFSVEKMASNYMEVYEQVLGGGGM